jgi:hypothetical protein
MDLEIGIIFISLVKILNNVKKIVPMKTFNLLLIFIILFTSSCEKEDSKAPGLFLNQIIYHRTSDEIAQYTYSNNGKLIRYEYTKDGVVIDKEDFTYINGRLDSSSFYSRALSSQPFTIWLQRSYEIDENERITNFYEYERAYYTERSFDFLYENGQLDSIVYESYDHVFNSPGERFYKVFFDANGNIVSTKCKYTDDIYGTWEYKYDNKKNPLKGLSSPENFATYFSANNVIKDKYSTYTYEYDENDLPVHCIWKFSNDPRYDTVITEVDYVYSEL